MYFITSSFFFRFGDANITGGNSPKKDLALMGTSFWKTVENGAEKLALVLETYLNLVNFLSFRVWSN